MLALPRNIWVLAASLALFTSLSVFVFFIGGIIGNYLAPSKSLSTLPVALLVVGTACCVVPANRIIEMIGRYKVFLGTCIFTLLNIYLAIIALQTQSFYIFCLTSFLFGFTMATMNQFRFAAVESVDKDLSATAISIVLSGGLISAFLGPELATRGKDLFATPFVGSFVLIGGCFVIAFILLWFYQSTDTINEKQDAPTRSLLQIIKQPIFIVAMSSATVGYVVMSYLMTATPMSMHVIDGISLENTKFVIQSHVIAMFLPSLFTPIVVKFLGLRKMMLIGVMFFFACVAISFSSHALNYYWTALVLLGLGWNFLFIGGTSLLSQAYNETEKFKVQSVNDFLIFGLQAIALLSAGWLVFDFGWEVVLLSTLPLLVMQLIILLRALKKGY